MRTYYDNFEYYDNYLNWAAKELFQISNFKLLLKINENYERIWNQFDIEEEFNTNDWFLPTLEFFYNIFETMISIALKELKANTSNVGNKRFWERFEIFNEFQNELEKFLNWNGYNLIKFDNTLNKSSRYKEYHLVKKEIAEIIDKLPIEKNLKTLLLELSKENLEKKDLENYLSIIYNNYLDNEKEQIKKCLGNKIHSDIFYLFNNGLIKHKDSKNINLLSQFDEKEKLNALKWLKDIVLVYFAISRNNNDYPEKIINFKNGKK
ncbi:MAG: hypothetical protein REH79_01525 [Spiroplasma sp.]|nr:hypothetical protein [Spiroplasma sp.]